MLGTHRPAKGKASVSIKPKVAKTLLAKVSILSKSHEHERRLSSHRSIP